MTISGGILAGGNGRRLGGVDKGALLLGDETLLSRQSQLLQRFCDQVLVANRDGDPVFAENGVGPLGGILQLLRRSAHPVCLIVSVDLFFWGPEVPEQLLQTGPCTTGVTMAWHEQRHIMCGLFHRDCEPVVADHLKRGQFSVRGLLEDSRLSVRKWQIPGNLPIPTDINTYSDFCSVLQTIC